MTQVVLAVVLLSGLCCGFPARAGVLAVYEWDAPGGNLPEGCSLAAADETAEYTRLAVAINDAEGKALRRDILTIEAPGINERVYLIKSMVRVLGARGCVVSLRSVFADGSERVMAKHVSMRMLHRGSGPTPWLPFVVDFMNDEDAEPPVRLVVSCQGLPGKKPGMTAEFRPIVLAQMSPDELSMREGDWWGPATGRHITVAGTALLVTLGVGIGLLCGLFRALRVAVVVSYSGLIVGLVLMILGGVALAVSQPGMVAVPILLGGALASLLFGVLGALSRRRYAKALADMESDAGDAADDADSPSA